MPTATKTESKLVECYYHIVGELEGSCILETKQNKSLYMINDDELSKLILTSLLEVYELGKSNVETKEVISNFNIREYLLR